MGYTPGPWEVKSLGRGIYGPLGGDSGDGVKADSTDGWHIAEIPRTPTFSELGEVELGAPRDANAHLIAAAPDLLEALEDALENFDRPSAWTERAREVIYQATGRVK